METPPPTIDAAADSSSDEPPTPGLLLLFVPLAEISWIKAAREGFSSSCSGISYMRISFGVSVKVSDLTSQSLTVAIEEPAARTVESAENARHVIQSPRTRKRACFSKLPMISQTSNVLSYEPVARRLPFGEKDTQVTSASCLARVWSKSISAQDP